MEQRDDNTNNKRPKVKIPDGPKDRKYVETPERRRSAGHVLKSEITPGRKFFETLKSSSPLIIPRRHAQQLIPGPKADASTSTQRCGPSET